MKCPHCGEELVRSTKNPDYLLCYTCKKKYRVPGTAASDDQAVSRKRREAEKARQQRDTAYTQMLDIGEDEERGGHGGLIFLIILLLIIAALVVGYFIFNIDYIAYIKQLLEHIRH